MGLGLGLGWQQHASFLVDDLGHLGKDLVDN